MNALWAAVQDSSFAGVVRNSTFVYPIANVTHVIAVIAFFGIVAVMDLRLLQVFGGAPASQVIARLRPVAVFILLAIVMDELILFSAEAVALARNTAFRIKIAAIGLALLNLAVNEWSLRNYGAAAPLVRFTAGISLLAWLLIAALGRTIAYV